MPAFKIVVKVPGHKPLVETLEKPGIVAAMDYATAQANRRGGNYLHCKVRFACDSLAASMELDDDNNTNP